MELADKSEDHAVLVDHFPEILLWRFWNQGAAILFAVKECPISVVRSHRRLWQDRHLQRPCMSPGLHVPTISQPDPAMPQCGCSLGNQRTKPQSRIHQNHRVCPSPMSLTPRGHANMSKVCSMLITDKAQGLLPRCPIPFCHAKAAPEHERHSIQFAPCGQNTPPPGCPSAAAPPECNRGCPCTSAA